MGKSSDCIHLYKQKTYVQKLTIDPESIILC